MAVVKLMKVIPATGAIGEKSFSTARTKTLTRLKIDQGRFDNVCALNIHTLRLDNLKLVEVANQYTDVNKNCHRNFGRLGENNLKRIEQP